MFCCMTYELWLSPTTIKEPACINNAYIIYKKYVRNPVSQDRFMEILAEKLIESSVDSCTIKIARPRSPSFSLLASNIYYPLPV